MKKNIFAKVFVLTLTVILTAFTVSAAGDFSITPTSYSLSANTNEAGSQTLTITNTGDENIDLTVSKIDLTDGSNTITLTLNPTTISNLAPGNTQNVTFIYNSGSNTGTFIGSVSVTNGTKTLSSVITLTITQETFDAPSLIFEGEGSILTIDGAKLGEEEKQTFTLRNNGNQELTNIEIDIDDLDAGSDTIKSKDIEINSDPFDDFKVDLMVGDSENVRIGVDVDNDIDVDTYRGDLTITADMANGSTYRKVYTLRVITESDDNDVFIRINSGDVRKGVLEVFAEPDEITDGIELVVGNDAGGDVNDLTLQLDGDLEEEDSSATISAANVQFDPNPVDVNGNDDETIDVEINVPDGTPTGTYIADLELRSSSGKKLDEISLKVKVIGDIYVSTIDFPEDAEPGDDVEVSVTVNNQGAKIYRNVKITGTLFDVEFGNGDITESSSSFMLDSNEEKTTTLNFQLPDDAQDGEATLEIKVNYDTQELYELESININRPENNIVVDSYAINPRVAKCDDQLFTFIKFRNLGKSDKDVKVSSEILGTNIIKSSGTYEVNIDEVDQQNLILDISNLEPGTYTVSQKIAYGSLFIKRDSDFQVVDCIDTAPGIDIKPINNTINNSSINQSKTSDDEMIELFGTDFTKTTVYLGTGLAFVVILIIIGLFLI